MIFWEMPDAAVKSWESAVDMVAARIPAMITPARSAGKIPNLLKNPAIWMMMVSESSRAGITPACVML